MAKKNYLLLGIFFWCHCIVAQGDLFALREVIVSDRQLREYSSAQSVLALNDSVIEKNGSALVSLLNYNSTIYFKENGLGMVASPSFRGTTAQHTAVVWNGLNVNSQFNGQTDFNAVSPMNFNAVIVRSGGGSVLYGSSAIGGSVHLDNALRFGKRFTNQLTASYGSFSTIGAHYQVAAGANDWAVQAGISRQQSSNDFEFPQDGRRNENGQYYNTSGQFSLGYKINEDNLVYLHSVIFDGDRYFSLISPTDTRTKYHDFNTRTMLEWQNVSGAFSSRLKAAFLTERYDYFGQIDNPASNYGQAQTFVAKYDGQYAFNASTQINATADITQTEATGSDVGKPSRQIVSFAMLMKSRPWKKWLFEAGLRQEITASYDSPLLFSAGIDWQVFRCYALKISGSKNFRIPTFNDLYWFDGGNPSLRPETSLQGEIGNQFSYRNWKLRVTGYYIVIDDMIQWLPGTVTTWRPENVNKVTSYGLENTLEWERKTAFGHWKILGTYAYTISENDRTGKQLIYVPFHKTTGALAYSWRNISADYQILYVGEVSTRSDNDARYNIDAYTVSNFGISYVFGKQDVVKIGCRVLNLFDENYQVVAGRPFPGRNYNVFLNLKF